MMQEAINRLRENIASVFLGNPEVIDRVICCLIADGHLLIEDVPGVGKTMLAMALARSLDGTFNRIQLTPDMLPSDVLGVSIYDRNSGEFELKKGPIFSNILLADEINRTSPRTQSALLEAMNEATVSIDGHVHQLQRPFLVIATQNPLDFEGAYPLPENQLDRFLMRIHLGYPNPVDELRVLNERPATTALPNIEPVVTRDQLLQLQQQVHEVKLADELGQYVISLAAASRDDDELRIGLSTRGALALAQAARASAVIAGRDYCIPEDITTNVFPVCAHRVFGAGYGAASRDGIGLRAMKRVLQSVPSPA